MSPKTSKMPLRLAILLLSAAGIFATGCSNGTMTNTTNPNTPTGPAFVVGTDAPMASVVSFAVQVESVELTDGTTNSGNILVGTPTVDFARFNGLQSLLDMNPVPAGKYTGYQITLGSATIGYLDTTVTPPAIKTEAATLTTTTVTGSLDKPLTVATGGAPVGVRVDFDLKDSVQTNSSGITGTVDPTFNVNTIARTDTGGYIDELVGGVVTLPSTSTPNNFVIAGPHGENFTIVTSPSTSATPTIWDGTASLATLTTNDIVEVSGTLDLADQTLDADEVAIVSDSKFYASGQITYVTAGTSGTAASNFDMYVRELEPTDISGSTGKPISLGQIAQVNLAGTEKYYIYSMHNPLTQFLFNSSSLVAGQDVAVGGPDTGVTAGASDLTVDRIHLRNWGFNGTIVKGSQSAGNGTFQMQVTGFAGVLVPTTVTVYLGGRCDFRYGFGAFGDLADGANVRVVGLLLKNPANGQLVLWARHVDGSNFTDFAATAWQ